MVSRELLPSDFANMSPKQRECFEEAVDCLRKIIENPQVINSESYHQLAIQLIYGIFPPSEAPNMFSKAEAVAGLGQPEKKKVRSNPQYFKGFSSN